MQSFTDLARSIAEERYPIDKSKVMDLKVHHREAYEACIIEVVWPLIIQLETTNNYLNGGGRIERYSMAHKDITHAIANFEGGRKVDGDGNKGLFAIAFTDCWEMDDRIDADQRWMAVNDRLKIVVTAPTKEQAFEEVLTSIRVMCAYESDFKLPPKH